jgi:hypothetical protein
MVACSGSDNGGTPNSAGQYVAPTGDPVEAQPNAWTWVPVDGAKCRDGSQAGFGINKSATSDKLMILLQGGGACYNKGTCAINPANYNSAGLSGLTNGLFDRQQSANPVKDWNFVFVPFCTGDVHAGSAEDVVVPGVAGTQQFVGYKNMDLFLDRIVPTFPHPSQVLHTGDSAGGFGSGLTADLVGRKFPPGTKITLLDDSGPPMGSAVLPPCLQKGWVDTWGFQNTVLKDCGADCPDPGSFALDWAFHLEKAHPDSYGGLIETTDDGVITIFYGYGANNCSVSGDSLAPPVSGDAFKAGLLDFRQQIDAKTKNFGTYYITGAQHTWIETPSFYTETLNGTSLAGWVGDMLNDKVSDVGP